MTIHHTLDTRDASAVVNAYRDWLIARDQTTKPLRILVRWHGDRSDAADGLDRGLRSTAKPVLHVVFEGDPPPVEKIFRHEVEPGRIVSVEIVAEGNARPARALCCPPARGLGIARTAGGGLGTAGWTVVLDGKIVTLTSWHVVDPGVENSLVGIEQDCPPVARVVEMRRPQPGKPASWDLAILALSATPVASDFDAAEAKFAADAASCGVATGYPMQLANPAIVTPDLLVSKVGVATGTTSGKFLEYGDYLVENQLLSGPVTLQLKEQLGFALPTQPGDSGSVIVDATSNAVLGIVTANIEGGVTIASPLFNLGWTPVANPGSPFPAFSRTSTS